MLNVDGHAEPIGWGAVRRNILLYVQPGQRSDVTSHLSPFGSCGIGFSVVLRHPEDGGADLPLTARYPMNKKVRSHRDLHAAEVQFRLLSRRLAELKCGKLVCHALDGM